MYFRSTFTGQVYKLNFIPMGEGWEPVHEDAYIEWCKSHGMEANKMILIKGDQLEAYAGELKAIIDTLTLAYANADLSREAGSHIHTVTLALERLAAKIEQVEE